MSDPTYYTPEEDKTKTLDDGREVLVAAKGIPILRQKALELGLIQEPKSEDAQEPQETQPPGGPHETQGVPTPGEVKGGGQPGSEVVTVGDGTGQPLPIGANAHVTEPPGTTPSKPSTRRRNQTQEAGKEIPAIEAETDAPPVEGEQIGEIAYPPDSTPLEPLDETRKD